MADARMVAVNQEVRGINVGAMLKSAWDHRMAAPSWEGRRPLATASLPQRHMLLARSPWFGPAYGISIRTLRI
jgi:hypothetical protein